ncbi:MAG TPA: hypothetical protein VKU60_01960 [Chloroflexota bacterium]|nr:hypothetical protein [Chloroflexota bacterium]
MDRMYVLERARDGKRFEFYRELKGDRESYIIREAGLSSQDSVTTDKGAVEAFREGLLHDGYMQMPL